MTTRTIARLLVGATLALSIFVGTAAAATRPPGLPPSGKVMLGVGGSLNSPTDFTRLTGTNHDIHLITVSWDEGRTWDYGLRRRFEQAQAGGYRIMVHIGSDTKSGHEGRSPGAVSRGAADAYLLDLGREVNNSNQYIYVRPPAEMNGHWSSWSAFDRSGRARNADHSTRMYRRAFVRIAAIVRGGDVATINQQLRLNGMPPLKTSATSLPRSGRVALVWNPQAQGSPNVRGNAPQYYYPGAKWVDYVANDLYEQRGRAAWSLHEALYNRYKAAHPFMVAEYAPWGDDNPDYVRKMFSWAATHRRTVALLYFNGSGGDTFRLGAKPRTLAAYKAAARATRYQCPALSAYTALCSLTVAPPGS